jgi:hypothetical protein
MPTTANCESQYVIDVAWIRNVEPSTARWRLSSIIECRLRWKSMIASPFATAAATPPRSARPRAAW